MKKNIDIVEVESISGRRIGKMAKTIFEAMIGKELYFEKVRDCLSVVASDGRDGVIELLRRDKNLFLIFPRFTKITEIHAKHGMFTKDGETFWDIVIHTLPEYKNCAEKFAEGFLNMAKNRPRIQIRITKSESSYFLGCKDLVYK